MEGDDRRVDQVEIGMREKEREREKEGVEQRRRRDLERVNGRMTAAASDRGQRSNRLSR